MRASYAWLKKLSGIDAPASDFKERLTRAGLEVESAEVKGSGLDGVIVAEVREVAPHPTKSNLRLVTVWDGAAIQSVVCGAPNVPEPGGRVLLARIGTTLPTGVTLEERAIGGVSSRGMLCSEAELGLGSESDGIVVLGARDLGAPGTSLDAISGACDTIFEISLTPNRPDALGHVGLARELAVLFGSTVPSFPWNPELAPSEIQGTGGAASNANTTFHVRIQDSQRCARYALAELHDLHVTASPLYVRARLHYLGVRPINAIVDATNWGMLEWGYPTHAFDAERLRGDRIEVRLAGDGEPCRTLDGADRSLAPDDLVIADLDGPIALAGVMGGEGSEVQETTRRIWLECGWFDPRSVRRTSRRLGIHTEASHRFERGVDRQAVPRVLTRVASLITEFSGSGVCSGAVDLVVASAPTTKVRLRRARLTAFLGAEVPDLEVQRTLAGLGCELEASSEGWVAKTPSWRVDMAREVDLIEEVARVRGYDLVPTELPRIAAAQEATAAAVNATRRLRERAASAGLHECRNFAFLSARDLEAARVSSDAVTLVNPLSEDRSVLRTSLLPGLLANVLRAQRHQVESAALFEVAHVFRPSASTLPKEGAELGILLAGTRRAWFGKGEDVDFYDIKGRLEAVLSDVALSFCGDVELESDAPFLHPRRSARVHAGGQRIGVAGELHPDVLESVGIRGRAVYAVVDVEAFFAASASIGRQSVSPLPKFPAVMRDIAIVVPEIVRAGDVAVALSSAGGSLLESVEIFDVYRGAPVPEGRKSVAFRLVYRDPAATLTDARVDEAHRKLERAIVEKFRAEVRAS